MTTWVDFLAELRADLQDEPTSSKPRWSDRMLWVYTKDAVRDYSTWFPKRIDRTEISPVNGAYPLPSSFIEEIFVESPKDVYLEKRMERPGTRKRPVMLTQRYYIQGGSIYLNVTPSDDTIVYLIYLGTHDVPVSESDDAFAFTVPDGDIELLRIYIKAQVYEQMRSRQASLDRFKVGTGSRDDNPLLPEVDEELKHYYEKIAERTRGGTVTLYRLGKLK
jgi:hypothetical protein